MFRPIWKTTLVGAFVAVVVAAAASQASACHWGGCGYGGCGYGGCGYAACGYGGCGYWGCGYGGCYRGCGYAACYSPCCYSSCCATDCCLGCRSCRRSACGCGGWYAGCCGDCGWGTYTSTASCCGGGEYPVYAAPVDSTIGPAMTPSAPAPAAPTPATKSATPPADGSAPKPPAGGPAGAGTTLQEPTQETSGLLTIWVPAEAKVSINGLATRSTGSKRQYVSFGLKPGFTYKYEIRAQIVRDGQLVEETRTVSLTAGERSAVAFGFNKPVEAVAAN
ncbi:MAG: TIGR03000 domain-containing protein [Thermoguttaceae bacterium]